MTTSTTPVATSTTATSTPAIEPPPKGLTLVHIIGTKYTDYFTDEKTVTAYPGDPNIDSHFNVPNAPIPAHAGLTWDHTSGGYLYDTPSGDLELGDYAVQPNGTYIENAPPFVSSTSTPVTTGAAAAPIVFGASTSTVPATSGPASTSTETTTPSGTTTSSIIPSSTTTDPSSTPSSVASPSVPDASTTTVPAPSDNSSTTTSSESTASPTL